MQRRGLENKESDVFKGMAWEIINLICIEKHGLENYKSDV